MNIPLERVIEIIDHELLLWKSAGASGDQIFALEELKSRIQQLEDET